MVITVLLSVVVSASSAGSCCSRSATGCSTSRVRRRRGGRRANRGRPRSGCAGVARHRPRRRRPSAVTCRPRSGSAARSRGYGVVLAGPVGGDGRPVDGRRRQLTRRGSTSPAARVAATSAPDSLDHAWTYSPDPLPTPSGRRDVRARHRRRLARSRCPPTASTYELYYLFPLDERAADPRRWSRGRCSPPAALLLLLVAGDGLAGDPPGRHPDAVARRVAERLAAGTSRSGCRSAARTTWPGSATSFNQMAANLQKQIRQLEEL